MLYLRLRVAALFASVRARRDLVLENLALRHQLAVYTRGRRRPRLRRHDRRFWSLLARGWSGWRGTLVMVEPDTVVRWHRSAWRAYWRWRSHRGSGRPRIPAELQQLIVRMATENPRWGAVRIVGELRAVGRQYSIQPMISAFRSQRRASRIRRMRFSCPTGWPRIRRYSAISGQTCTDQVLPSHGRSPTRRRRRAARLCRFPGVLSRRRGRDPASKPQMSDSSSTSEAATVGSSALSAIVA